MAHTAHKSRRLALLLGVGVGLGCGGDLPLAERIVSTRPLAIRVEVAEPGAPEGTAVRAEALPFGSVRLVPLFVDPQGPLSSDRIIADLDPVWLACPMQPVTGLLACLQSKLPLTPTEVPACPLVDPGGLGEDFDIVPQPSPCRIEGGTPAEPEFVVPIDPAFLIGGDLEITMVAHRPGSPLGTTACLEALLAQATLPTDCLFAVQRVAIGPDAELVQLAIASGLIDPAALGPIPDVTPDADRHPRIESFDVEAFDPAGELVFAQRLTRGQTLSVASGTRLELTTVAPSSELQTYLVPRDASEFDERTETYSGSWFRSWGDLLSPVSDDPRSVNTWTMVAGDQDESERPPDDRAVLYYVLRDDRQGVDWWWFFVEVQPR